MNKKTLTVLALGTAAVAAPLWLRRRAEGRDGVIGASLLIERPADEVWQAWRRIEELPRHLRHVERVEPLGGGRSRWTGVAPGGRRLEWEAQVVEETPGRRLVWTSLPGSEVRHQGEVEVLPSGEGAAILQVAIEIEGGRSLAGLAAAHLEGLTRRALREDLGRFKSRMEAGEVPRTDGQPTGERPAVDPTNPL